MKKSSFFSVESGQWPVVIITFNRELSKDPLQEAKDMKEWIEHFGELTRRSQEEGTKFVGIYDHTLHQYPSGVFRIKTMQYIKEKFGLMEKSYFQFIMIMPSIVTRMALKAGLAITKFPAPVKLVSNLDEAMYEAKSTVMFEVS